MIQRERIAALESENNIQKLEIEWLHTVIEESDADISKKIIEKMNRQSILLHDQGMKIHKLKREIEDLTLQLVELWNKIKKE